MALALFDLDNTLLNGDSDHAWGLYLADIGVVDANEHQQAQDYFYEQYKNGSLDIEEFLAFQLATLGKYPMQQLQEWRNAFIQDVATPMLDHDKLQLVEKHRKQGDTLVIITATNDFVTRPIADLIDIESLIATEAEIINGQYTGKVSGTPCYQAGKITKLEQWLDAQAQTGEDRLKYSWFYSDSHNDIPLLSLVDNPVAVKPDDTLRAHAESRQWQIID